MIIYTLVAIFGIPLQFRATYTITLPPYLDGGILFAKPQECSALWLPHELKLSDSNQLRVSNAVKFRRRQQKFNSEI